LRLAEVGRRPPGHRPTREEQRPEVIERIEEIDRDIGEAKDDHDRRYGPVDAIEQPIQREHNEDLDRRREQIGVDT
jgi:hypothetical protein